MDVMVSQITSPMIAYSTVYSGAYGQMASNAENVSIWWRHHVSRWNVTLVFSVIFLSELVELTRQMAETPFINMV